MRARKSAAEHAGVAKAGLLLPRSLQGVVTVPSAKRAITAVACLALVLGLGALAMASAGAPGLLAFGLASLVVGALVAGVTRWRIERESLDGQAIADLAIACAELERGDPTAAACAASKAAGAAGTQRVRNRALTTLAWAALGQGYAERAKAVLDRVRPPYAVDLHCLAAVEQARGRPGVALQALEVLRETGNLTSDSAKILVDCTMRVHGIGRAVQSALQNRRALGVMNCQQVLAAARLLGAEDAAAKLEEALAREAPVLTMTDRHAE
jgi:hypothetical protein